VRAIAGSPARKDASTVTSQTEPLGALRNAGWLLIAVGAISVIAGVLAIAYPDITLLALAIFAGVNLCVLSGLSLVDAFTDDADGGSRALSAILGVLGLIAGLVILRRPGETLLVLVLVIGIWLVVSGVVHLIRGLGLPDRAVHLVLAAAEIVLGGLILALPDLSLRTVAVLAGIGFVLRGVVAIYAGWQLRKAGAHPARLSPA
jgi:uncharacterized membrane protein HdeD (DUF308 family)